MKGIVPIYNVHSGTDYHRIFLPLTHLGVEFKKRLTLEQIKETRAIVFNRYTQELDRILSFRRDFGIKIIVDIDDYFELPTQHYLSKIWNGKEIVKCIVNADAVTVTTVRLADKIKQYNKNIHVIPNAIPFSWQQFNSAKNESEQIRFASIGGASHLMDISLLKYPIQKIASEASNKATFFLCGYDNTNEPTRNLWNKIEGQFTGGGLLKKMNSNIPLYVRKKTLPLNQYMTHYDDCDVLLTPLEANNFNQYKSNLKIIEAGCKHSAIITSNYPPYSDEATDLFKMCSNAKDWYSAIKYYLNNRQAAIDDGLKLGEYVRQHYDLAKINEIRKQLYESFN